MHCEVKEYSDGSHNHILRRLGRAISSYTHTQLLLSIYYTLAQIVLVTDTTYPIWHSLEHGLAASVGIVVGKAECC